MPAVSLVLWKIPKRWLYSDRKEKHPWLPTIGPARGGPTRLGDQEELGLGFSKFAKGAWGEDKLNPCGESGEMPCYCA